jgi:hypothetical protein
VPTSPKVIPAVVLKEALANTSPVVVRLNALTSPLKLEGLLNPLDLNPLLEVTDVETLTLVPSSVMLELVKL